MTKIRNTNEMMYPLEAPNGWFLHHAAHEHTPIIFNTDFHEPVRKDGGPWVVEFQKYPKGGRLTAGRGNSLEEAWHNAAVRCIEQDAESEE